MLTLIRIANYAIIDEVELELEPGFSVLTGETGAGKSILVDALGLALGDRADSGAVRAGAKRAEIGVVFEIPETHPAHAWLRERELDDGDVCALRRSIGAEGRSRAFVNNQPVTLDDLRALGALLVDIHGQHAHQSLLDAAAQRAVLDGHAGLAELAARVAAAFRASQEAEAALRAVQARSADRAAELERLRFEYAELEALDLAAGEVERLESERGRLANVDRLMQGIGAALAGVYESDEASAHAQAAHARRALEALVEHDAELAAPAEQLARAEIELRDAATTLARYRDRLEADPARLEFLEARLARVRVLTRRHRVADTALAGVAAELAAAIESLDGGESSLARLAGAAAEHRARYLELAEQLSQKRRDHAAALDEQVSAKLGELGLPHGAFRAAIERKPAERFDATGLDRIELQVRLNPGQPFGPIGRAASGGELSRISLALEVVATDASTIPTFVFDEVDAGIGGGVAEIVGRRLREIARRRQVLCVTHLPQVASQGERHYRVAKTTDGKTSRTEVVALSPEERVEELSRMLGGVRITERTRAHAEEMMQGGNHAHGKPM